MLTHEQVTDILLSSGVLLEGHFLLTSGKHSNRYLQCAQLFKDPKHAGILCGELADMVKDEGIQLVIGPAMGAVQMAYEVSRFLGCENCFAERDADGVMTLRRGFSIKPGTRVMVVEDVVTTGGSVMEVIRLVQEAGGIVVVVGSIVDRAPEGFGFGEGIRFVSTYRALLDVWEAENCPLCKEGALPAQKPGSRK